MAVMPEPGALVFIDGNQAAIVIGEDADGGVIVGTFAGAQTVERGHYGDVPSEAGLPPSTAVEGSAGGTVVGPALVVEPSAGGLETAEPVQTGTTDTTIGDDEAAEAQQLADKDAEIADLRAQLAAHEGTTPPVGP